MDYKIKGKVVAVGEVKAFGSNGFKKRELVIDNTKNEAYPSPAAYTLKKDDCDKANTLNVGDEVSVEGFIEGRKWDGPNGVRYFTDLVVKSIIVERAAKIEVGGVHDWASLLAYATSHGESEDALKARCRKYCEEKKVEYKNFTLKNWTELADGVPATAAVAEEGADDDMPF